METKFNFNSAICTDRSQSERLLALGLKEETADMALVPLMEWDDCTAQEYFTGIYVARTKEDVERYNLDYIPAWSLDRLMELVPHRYGEYCDYANNYMYYYNLPLDFVKQFVGETKYEYLIDCIEWLIKKRYFNKEYLV